MERSSAADVMMPSWRARLSSIALERGGILSFVILVMYLWVAPTFIVDGDNAEFSTLSVTGGAAHPPGYPLYVMYLRAMSWLPGVSQAHTAALSTALLGAIAALVLHAACRAWGARSGAASIAVAIMAGGPVVLRLHAASEVFALNDLIVALVLWLAASRGPLLGSRRAFALGLVAGLGLSNQHTCALLAPVGILGVVRGARESGHAVRTIALAIAGLVCGLLPYLYLFVAPLSAASWGHVDSMGKLLAHFTREDYGGIGAFSPIAGEIDPVKNLAALARTLGRAWLWVPAALAVATLGYRCVKTREGEPRVGWAMLATSFLVAGPVLIARFDVDPVGLGLYVCERFHLLAVVLLTVPAAIGLDDLARRFGLEASTRASRRALGELLAVTVFVAAAGLSLPHVLHTHSPAVEKGIVNLLRSLPPDAVVIGTADDVHFGVLYVQEARKIRPDVDVIAWPMTTLPWYREHFARRGLLVDPYVPGDEVPSVRVARQIFASSRPLFVEISLGNILKTFESYPYGMVFRVLPPGTHKPTLDDIVEVNRELFAAFDLDYPRPDAGTAYAVEMHARYARTWDILARALRDAGRVQEARAASALVRQLVPAR